MGKRILIVEDDPVNSEFLDTLLSSKGHDCVQASTGEDAIHHLDTGRFDLILLDIMLPGKSGAEVAWTARQQGVTTPILAVTAALDRWDEEDLADLGVNKLIAKPFENESLLAEVDAALAAGSTPGADGGAS